MKTTVNGKKYDSEKCEVLGEIDHYNKGLYSGTKYLLRASDGMLLVHSNTNGNDLFFTNDFSEFERYTFGGYDLLNDFEMTDEQEELAIKYGIVKAII
jgi:hypothetical protein